MRWEGIVGCRSGKRKRDRAKDCPQTSSTVKSKASMRPREKKAEWVRSKLVC